MNGRKVRRYAAAAASAAVLAGTLSLVGTAPAVGAPAVTGHQISPAVSGDRRCVTWSKVFVRNYPAGQAWTQLYQNQTFSVYEYRASGWARGFAWGYVNTDQSPYAAPYNNVWVESAALGKHVNDGSTC